MTNRNNPIPIMNPQTSIGILTETEMLFVDATGGKRILHSLLLPAKASDLSRLVESLWQAELSEVWVLPTTPFSRTVTCASWEQVPRHWTTRSLPTRLCPALAVGSLWSSPSTPTAAGCCRCSTPGRSSRLAAA